MRQRTSLVNALRAHLAEFGVIAPQGLCRRGPSTHEARAPPDGYTPGRLEADDKAIADHADRTR